MGPISALWATVFLPGALKNWERFTDTCIICPKDLINVDNTWSVSDTPVVVRFRAQSLKVVIQCKGLNIHFQILKCEVSLTSTYKRYTTSVFRRSKSFSNFSFPTIQLNNSDGYIWFFNQILQFNRGKSNQAIPKLLFVIKTFSHGTGDTNLCVWVENS